MDAQNRPEIGDKVFDGTAEVGTVGHVYTTTPEGYFTCLIDGLGEDRDIRAEPIDDETGNTVGHRLVLA